MRTKIGTIGKLVALGAATALAGCGGSDGAAPPQVTVLSASPDLVSGADAVIEVRSTALSSDSGASVTLNGMDVTSALVFDRASNRLVGKVKGLRAGDNVVVARATSNGLIKTVTIKSSALNGPVVAGAKSSTWVCETAASGLGAPLDAQCTVPKKVDWFYRADNSTFKPLASLSKPYPADLVTTTTTENQTVPFIVRVESGTLNQAIFRVAILDDPEKSINEPWSATGTKPGAGWNGKLNLVYGGSCSPGYTSGSNTIPAGLEILPLSYDTAVAPLGLGFAVAYSSRMALGNGCDLALSAENTLKLKEHFIVEYGQPKFTIGSGPSGGSMQVHYVAEAYPGLLDGIVAGVSFPDVISVATEFFDCALLYRHFAASGLPVDAQSAITGYPETPTGNSCRTWALSYGISLTASNLGFSAAVPKTVIYDPVTNPQGARGSVFDQNVNVLGRDAQTGFARRTYDNVGVQYGLFALNQGKISVQQFLELNTSIGGFDADGNAIQGRTQGNLEAITAAYRSALITSGRGLTLPIVDTRAYTDDRNDIHTRVHTFSMMARLQAANGTSANQVNLMVNGGPGGVFSAQALTRQALVAQNEWLERVGADTSSLSYAEKVLRNKPATLADACWDASGTKITEAFTLAANNRCNQLYPVFADPRIVAGEGIARDTLKCTLKPVDNADYKVPFTSAQTEQLRGIFPGGVCDWSKGGQGRVESVAWQRY